MQFPPTPRDLVLQCHAHRPSFEHPMHVTSSTPPQTIVLLSPATTLWLEHSVALRLGIPQEITWRLASRRHSPLATSCQCWKYGSLPKLLRSTTSTTIRLCPVEFPQKPFIPHSSLLSQKSLPLHGPRSLRSTLRHPSVVLSSPTFCHDNCTLPSARPTQRGAPLDDPSVPFDAFSRFSGSSSHV